MRLPKLLILEKPNWRKVPSPRSNLICNSCGASDHFARATVTHHGQRELPRQRRVNAVAFDPDDEEYTKSMQDGVTVDTEK